MKLSTKIETFVAHFGEMGSRWGFNRTVGQMYALLMVYNRPLNADEISEMLSISRSNVSMGLKELQSWRPTLTMLRDEMMREPVSEEGKYAQVRMTEIYELIDNVSKSVDELSSLSTKDLRKMLKMGTGIASVFLFKDKLTGNRRGSNTDSSSK